jgi:hypothetical protein
VRIGTGVLEVSEVGKALKPLLKTMMEMVIDTQSTARRFNEGMIYRYGTYQDIYYQFDVHAATLVFQK